MRCPSSSRSGDPREGNGPNPPTSQVRKLRTQEVAQTLTRGPRMAAQHLPSQQTPGWLGSCCPALGWQAGTWGPPVLRVHTAPPQRGFLQREGNGALQGHMPGCPAVPQSPLPGHRLTCGAHLEVQPGAGQVQEIADEPGRQALGQQHHRPEGRHQQRPHQAVGPEAPLGL